MLHRNKSVFRRNFSGVNVHKNTVMSTANWIRFVMNWKNIGQICKVQSPTITFGSMNGVCLVFVWALQFFKHCFAEKHGRCAADGTMDAVYDQLSFFKLALSLHKSMNYVVRRYVLLSFHFFIQTNRMHCLMLVLFLPILVSTICPTLCKRWRAHSISTSSSHAIVIVVIPVWSESFHAFQKMQLYVFFFCFFFSFYKQTINSWSIVQNPLLTVWSMALVAVMERTFNFPKSTTDRNFF